MRTTAFLFLCIWGAARCAAQWTVTSAPNTGGRKDDIFFIGPDTGWVAGGVDGNILRTQDGGDTWQSVYSGSDYLRSIEFATPLLGFCGSLTNTFLRSIDGGGTWTDISAQIPTPTSICGLCAPTAERIYGVGIWSGPAYLIRSTDGGVSWTNADLSGLASCLVDVYFLNADTGFVSGGAQPASLGGVILGTTDGGDTWTVLHHTGQAYDLIWKLQSPDHGSHLFGSIESALDAAGTRFVRSSDAGTSWEMLTATTVYHYIQAIGFMDTLHGWMGSTTLMETQDGGITWQDDVLPAGGAFDRFHKISDTQAFLSGSGVYRYDALSTGLPVPPVPVATEQVRVVPNPAVDAAQVQMVLIAPSRAELILCSADGRIARAVFQGELKGGDNEQALSLKELAPGVYRLVLRTNQGQCATSFVKE